METDELLKVAAEGGFGQRKQGALKALVRCEAIQNDVLIAVHAVFET